MVYTALVLLAIVATGSAALDARAYYKREEVEGMALTPGKKRKGYPSPGYWGIYEFPDTRIRHRFVGECKARGVDWKVLLKNLMVDWLTQAAGEQPRVETKM